MPLQNLTGKWTGQYTYGKSYGPEMAGLSVAFVMEIKDNGHLITGTCIDDEMKGLFKEPATIEGSFDKDYISFIKKYPCRFEFDENNHAKLSEDEPSFPIHYTGTLRKMLFSRKYVFRGEWELTSLVRDESGRQFYYTAEGSWTMKLED